MNKSFDDVLILKHDWTVGQIVKDFVVSEVIVLDNSYEIPAMCAHMDDELISTLLKQNYLTLYGVFDNNGRIHINIDDFNRLKKYLGDEDTTNDCTRLISSKIIYLRKNILLSEIIVYYILLLMQIIKSQLAK